MKFNDKNSVIFSSFVYINLRIFVSVLQFNIKKYVTVRSVLCQFLNYFVMY